MICRIFYTNKYEAQQMSLPRVGTKYEINTIEELQELQDTTGEPFVFYKLMYPHFISDAVFVRREDWLQHFDEDVVEDEYLVEYPTEDWLTCQWIEVYNGYRE